MLDLVLGVLPYWEFGPWPIWGPLKIHSFGLSVAIGLILCFYFSGRRAERKLGASAEELQNMGFYVVAIGWVFAHVLNVLMYEPHKVAANPLILLKVWGSISSYGGLIGGFIGFFVWHRFHPQFDRTAWMGHAAWSLPIPWFFGRIGCATVHDHPGRLAEDFWLWEKIRDIFGKDLPEIFPLAIDFSESPYYDGIRHDLGLYEAIWWFPIVLIFFWLDRKPRPPGFYLAVLPLLYAPGRFLFDFLRIPESMGGDARYLGLTPAQYLSLGVFIAGAIYLPIVLKREPLEWKQWQPEAAIPPEERDLDAAEESDDEDDDDASRSRSKRRRRKK
jgi:phosphatidylglycerol:prolipoprotein diacylglycerol transferase